MITKEQIKRYCDSGLLWAKLDRDYKADRLDYVLPAGTIVQVELYRTSLGDLYLNSNYIDVAFLAVLFVDGQYVDYEFPYDAATLLETEE